MADYYQHFLVFVVLITIQHLGECCPCGGETDLTCPQVQVKGSPSATQGMPHYPPGYGYPYHPSPFYPPYPYYPPPPAPSYCIQSVVVGRQDSCDERNKTAVTVKRPESCHPTYHHPEGQASYHLPQSQALCHQSQAQAPYHHSQGQASYHLPHSQAPCHQPQSQSPCHQSQSQAPYHQPRGHASYHQPLAQALYHHPQGWASYHLPQSQAPYHQPQSQAPFHQPQSQTPYHQPQPQPLSQHPQTRAPCHPRSYQQFRTPPGHSPPIPLPPVLPPICSVPPICIPPPPVYLPKSRMLLSRTLAAVNHHQKNDVHIQKLITLLREKCDLRENPFVVVPPKRRKCKKKAKKICLTTVEEDDGSPIVFIKDGFSLEEEMEGDDCDTLVIKKRC